MSSLNNHDPCLILLCKRPALGHSKQRLAEGVGKGRTLDIAQLFLDCAVENSIVNRIRENLIEVSHHP